MFDQFFNILSIVDDFYWSHIGFVLVITLGIYFTIKSRFFQFRTIRQFRRTIRDLYHPEHEEGPGTHPLRLYFASVGGMIGLGNVVGVISALIIGGPGALLWLWLASFSGMLIKYAEIYLGVRFRTPNNRGGYDGGPMYYLRHAFNIKSIPVIVAILLCIYGVEVYQFVVITDTLSQTFDLPKIAVILGILVLILYTVLGGINRLANICTVMMPIFMVVYLVMCLWVIGSHIALLPGVLSTVFYSAFNGHAALGAFAGSTVILAAQNGIARAVYSGDIGIGYDSTIQAETQIRHPERQARMAIFALLTDSMVCTLSMLVVLITGLWHNHEGLLPSQFVAKALGIHFPHMDIFMAGFFFLAGFTTIIAFFAVGMKCAKYLSETWGERLYLLYGIAAFSFFAFYDQTKVLLIMSLSGGFLMLVNLAGILKLRHHIEFK
jgi:alanine or glycine:cation symporter, AGCS family